jgi:hypothetical protein
MAVLSGERWRGRGPSSALTPYRPIPLTTEGHVPWARDTVHIRGEAQRIDQRSHPAEAPSLGSAARWEASQVPRHGLSWVCSEAWGPGKEGRLPE